jgi:hypothetical protein
MSNRFITRREFEQSLLSAVFASPVLRAAGPAQQPAAVARARFQVTRRAAALTIPPSTPSGEIWRYGLAYPFQVAPGRAVLFVNIRGNRGHDFEIGTDAVLFDSLSGIRAEGALAVSRNHEETNPNSQPAGRPSIMVKYPLTGGFVPQKAKRADGTAHPHAGTGFGFCVAEAWARDSDRAFPPAELYEYLEVQQFAFDGVRFKVERTDRIPTDRLLPGWRIEHPGISHAVADGDDFLLAVRGSADRTNVGSGVMRWRRGEKGWQAVSFVPIEEFDNAHGPSLMRDLDGSLIFCAAGTFGTEFDNDARLWRSRDSGATWQPLLHLRSVTAAAPHSINRAADGTPYLGATLFEVFLHPARDTFRRRKDPQGRVRAGGRSREKLAIWPLGADRADVETAILVRDARAEFGPPPSGTSWFVDHPSAMTVHLGDGRWHHLLAFRICDGAEVLTGAPPARQTGTYVEEVTSAEPVVPLWRF